MNIKTEAKFNLEDAASEVYEKAESMYKGSEITTDILDTIIDKYFSKKYSPRQLQTIKDYFKEQEEIFYSMYNDGNEITENKKVTEATDSTMDGKDITNEFQFIKAFQSNFEPIKVIKNSYDKNYYIYRADETNTNNYLDFSKSKDYIEGWLNGAIKAKNNVISSKTESLQENTQLGRIPTSELPDFCYSYNETTGEIIVIKKGVEGYYPSNITLDNTLSGDERKQQAEELIKEQNEILGVTDDQRLQMELNSMFGWDDTKIENKKLNESTQQFIIGLTNKTAKELAEDETYDSYVEDIKDSDNIYGIEVGLTDNREEALRFDNKTDAEIAASEIEQIQDTFQTVIVIAL